MPELYEGKKDWEYDVIREGEENILYIYVEHLSYAPSIEDYATVMSMLMDILAQVTGITKIVFSQKREHEYDYSQTKILMEIVDIYKKIIQEKDMFSYSTIGLDQLNVQYINQRFAEFQNLAFKMLKSDPISAYVELLRALRREKIDLEKITEPKFKEVVKRYAAVINYVVSLLEKTRLIELAKPYIPGYKLGDRSIYRYIFTPVIKPDFMFTKLMSTFPPDGEEIDSYTINDESDVTIFKFPDDTKVLYHLMPPEFKLSEDKYELLDIARKIMAEHKPREEEFTDPERMREVFFNIGHDLLEELAKSKNIMLRGKEIDKLTDILVRYTVGFGLIEVLLQDEKIQDISINSPMGKLPMFIVHADHGDCYTNIVPTKNESEGWASKLRLISGRPLDEANPILDTELELPNASTRVAVISKPLNPTGLAYSFRRHRDKPWTLPLFVKAKMINPTAAGLLSFLIDGTRTMLIAGTRSSGKSSLLSGLIVEIMRKYRIITIEDSVAGDSNIIIRRNGLFERTTIGKLIDHLINKYGCRYRLSGHGVLENKENIEVFAMNKKGKIKLAKVSKFIRHKVKKPIYTVTTRTGRKIKITGDHSLFGLDDNANIIETKVKDLKIGSYIAVPRVVNNHNHEKKVFEFLKSAIKLSKSYFIGKDIKKFLNSKKNKIKKIGKDMNYSKPTINRWFRVGIIPGKVLNVIFHKKCLLHKYSNILFKIKKNSTTYIPTKVRLDKDILTFLGLWLADGCYDKNSVIVSSVTNEERGVIKKIAKRFNLKVKLHSDKISYMLNSKTLKIFMKKVLEIKGNAYTKRIPKWMFNLSNKQMPYVLKGIFSGDGCVSANEIVIPLASLNLLKDIQTMLLYKGIILRIGTKRKDKTYNATISSHNSWLNFKIHVGFLQHYKNKKVDILCNKVSTHDCTDIIPLSMQTKKEIKNILPNFNYSDYITRNNNIGRRKLKSMLKECKNSHLVKNLKIVVNSDIFWDEIRDIKITNNKPIYVYDISVPHCESFICENIIAHNTLELPCKQLREMGFNIQSMKVASALGKESTEVDASTGIRTTLRLGDSALIIGEVRSKEAIALYEAMRVGAAANVVAGTIHSDSPYGVYDRVVNDIGIPKTSFKATDVCIVANPIRSADGLHRFRRVTQITEVRKHWTNDPLEEKGFVDLMKYDADKDELVVTPDLQNGDSDVLKAIAGNIKEFAGDWDAIWDNIQLRASITSTLVDVATKSERLDLLEAPFVIKSNDMYHILAEKVKAEVGSLDSKKILFEWNEWLKRELRKKM